METSVNNKCKAFTSLEQSKKLAEILPLESADMMWKKELKYRIYSNEYKVSEADFIYYPIFKEEKIIMSNFDVSCWSLASLLNIIPQEIFDGEYIINITEGRDNRWVLTYDHYENRNHSYFGLPTGADNLIDACYKMIIKLNELNLL